MGSTPQEYWGNLIDPERKCASPRLDALLSGIAHYIIKNLDPREHHVLTGEKLAAYYRSVGGDFDGLFLETPPASLSFVYQALGCYHSLQPTENAFAPPAIPALTASGFKRWQTIQLLLQPAEQVPLLQKAVQKYDIINKADGHVFPKILPAECFPRDPDPVMTRWHDESLQKLKREAEQEAAAKAAPRPAMAREYSGTPTYESSSGDEGDKGYFSIARWKGNIASRWDRFRGDGRPMSREDRNSRERDRDRDRERRRRAYDDGGVNGSMRYHKRPSMGDNGRRRSHPGHRVSNDGRGGRARTFAQGSYDSPPSPTDLGFNPRTRARPQYAARGQPLSPNMPDRDRNRDRDRERDRRYASGEPSPRSSTPPPPRSPPVSYDTRPNKQGRRHSSHSPLSPRPIPESPDLFRARSRSQESRSPNDRLKTPASSYGSKPRPGSAYIPAATTATSGISATAPPSTFARGNLRHTVHAAGHGPYQGRFRDEPDDPAIDAGVRYIPTDRQRRADRV